MKVKTTTYMYGMAKYVSRVAKTETKVIETKQRYIFGIKYWEKSSTRPTSIVDNIKSAYGM